MLVFPEAFLYPLPPPIQGLRLLPTPSVLPAGHESGEGGPAPVLPFGSSCQSLTPTPQGRL